MLSTKTVLDLFYDIYICIKNWKSYNHEVKVFNKSMPEMIANAGMSENQRSKIYENNNKRLSFRH